MKMIKDSMAKKFDKELESYNPAINTTETQRDTN